MRDYYKGRKAQIEIDQKTNRHLELRQQQLLDRLAAIDAALAAE